MMGYFGVVGVDDFIDEEGESVVAGGGDKKKKSIYYFLHKYYLQKGE